VALCQNEKLMGKDIFFLIFKGTFVKAYKAILTENFINNVSAGVYCSEMTIISRTKSYSMIDKEELITICQILCGLELYYNEY